MNNIDVVLKTLPKLSIEELILVIDKAVSLKKEKLDTKALLDKAFIDIRQPECFNLHKDKLIKYGLTKAGSQKFYCKECKKYISIKQNSNLSSTKKNLYSWNKYLVLFNYRISLNKVANDLHISKHTAFLWRHKIMESVSDFDKGIKLSGKIWLDEIEFHDNYKGSTPPERPTRNNSKDFSIKDSGIYTIRVILGIDENDNIITIVTNSHKSLEIKEAYALLKDKIVPGSTIITDYTNGYNLLVEKLKLEHIQYKSTDHTPEAEEAMMPINNLCSEVTSFFERYHGVATKYFQRYLDYFRFAKFLNYTIEEERIKLLKYFEEIVKSKNVIKVGKMLNKKSK